ncbi:MAG: acyltransferase family protein [Erythrobacter sp.]
MNRLLGIQYLRAVAALAVVCFHAAAKEKANFLIGEAGVDVFFVISGFLMVAITNDTTKPWEFFKNRIKRILPIYWIATTVMLLGIIFGLFPNARIDLWHVMASYLFLPAISPATGEIWPLLVPGWTLNYEMSFYALFAVALFISNEKKRVFLIIILLFAMAIFGIIFSPEGVSGRFYCNQIVLEFAAGSFLGLLWKQHRALFRHGRSLIGLSVFGFAMAWLVDSDANRALVFGVPSLLLVAGVLAVEHARPIERQSLALLLGNASYSIYIWHTLAISVTSKLAALVGLSFAAAVAFNIVGGVLIGLAAYAVLEEPLRKLLNPKQHQLAPSASA